MKKVILSLLTLILFVLITSSCDKRVNCVCTAVPVEPSEQNPPSEFYMTLKDGGDCEDGNGPFVDSRGVQYNATCEESIIMGIEDPQPVDGN
jgi:hypothetical protein